MAEMAPVQGTVVPPPGGVVTGTVVTPGAVDPNMPVATVVPVAFVIPEGAKVGTVVAVQGPAGPQNLAVPPHVKPGETWNVMFPSGGNALAPGFAGIAQLIGGADRIEIRQKVARIGRSTHPACRRSCPGR